MKKSLSTVAAMLLALLLAAQSTRAQTGNNVVGFYNLAIKSGANLVANQLDTTNNSLNFLFDSTSSSGLLPDGSIFKKWDAAANTFLPNSVYNKTLDTWSINYSLNPGEGGDLVSSVTFTNLFVGTVLEFNNVPPNTGLSPWAPGYGPGLWLISAPDPVSGPAGQLFAYATGRNPVNGEQVEVFNPTTQAFTTTTYHALGNFWDNGNPSLTVGESAFFNLSAPAPEPSAAALLVSGASALWFFRRKIARR